MAMKDWSQMGWEESDGRQGDQLVRKLLQQWRPEPAALRTRRAEAGDMGRGECGQSWGELRTPRLEPAGLEVSCMLCSICTGVSPWVSIYVDAPVSEDVCIWEGSQIGTNMNRQHSHLASQLTTG